MGIWSDVVPGRRNAGFCRRNGTDAAMLMKRVEGSRPMIQIPLSPEQFAAAGRELEEKQGVVLTGNEGKLTKMGVTASYQYKDGVLSIVILEKPFFVSTEYCEEQLRKFLGHEV